MTISTWLKLDENRRTIMLVPVPEKYSIFLEQIRYHGTNLKYFLNKHDFVLL